MAFFKLSAFGSSMRILESLHACMPACNTSVFEGKVVHYFFITCDKSSSETTTKSTPCLPCRPFRPLQSYTTFGLMVPGFASRSARRSPTSTACGDARMNIRHLRRMRATTARMATWWSARKQQTSLRRGAKTGGSAAGRGKDFACTRSSPSIVSLLAAVALLLLCLFLVF